MTQKIRLHYMIVVLLLSALFATIIRDSTAADTNKSTAPTSKPVENTVLGKMSINGVELQYSGPVEISDGTPVVVGLSLLNSSDSEICIGMTRIEQRLSFDITTKSPKGKVLKFQSNGIPCTWVGEGILSLDSNKFVQEKVDLAQYLTDGPGIYQLTIMRSYNGVVHFPGYELRLDIPITVVAKKGG